MTLTCNKYDDRHEVHRHTFRSETTHPIFENLTLTQIPLLKLLFFLEADWLGIIDIFTSRTSHEACVTHWGRLEVQCSVK